MEAQVESFTSSNNQKEDNNQYKINKQPKVPENQTAWNSNNQGIKEKINQNNQTGKAAGPSRPTQKNHADMQILEAGQPALGGAQEGLT